MDRAVEIFIIELEKNCSGVSYYCTSKGNRFTGGAGRFHRK